MLGVFGQLRGRFLRDEQGTALVEMALIAPLLVVLSAGVFEFGNMIQQKMLMQAGVNDAARFAARCNSQMYTDFGLAAINRASLAANIAVFGNASGTGSPRVGGWATTNVTVDIANVADCHDAVVSGVTQYRSVTSQVCLVRVTNSKVYSDIGMLSVIGIGPMTLTGTHEERLMRF